MYEEEDEEYLNDIISLNYFPIKTEDPVIDLCSDEEDDKSRVFAPRSSYGNRSFVLPITFFDISRNVEFLKKCRPLCVKVVDCEKHPFYYEKILRPKPPSLKTYPELTRILNADKYLPNNVAIDDGSPANEIVDNTNKNDVNITKEYEIEVNKLKPRCSSIQKEINRDPPDTGASQNVVLNKDGAEERDPVGSKNINSHVDFKRNKGLVGIVITKKDLENKPNSENSNSAVKKKVKEKLNNKQSVKDIGKTANTLEKQAKQAVKRLESRCNDVLEKDSKATDGRIETRESSKNVDASISDSSPTLCSIKITCPKVFEKAIKLKNGFHKEPIKSKINSSSGTENILIKDQAIPKLSLKRKKTDIKEFYIINPVKETNSDSQNKNGKSSEEMQNIQPIKSDAQVHFNKNEQKTLLPNSEFSKKPNNYQKPVSVQTPKVVAKSMKVISNRKNDNLKDGTHKIIQRKESHECPKNVLNCQLESIKNVKKSDKLIKSKYEIKSLKPTDNGPPKPCTTYYVPVPIGTDSNFMVQNKIGNENVRPNQDVARKKFLIVQDTHTPVNLQNTLNKIRETIQNEPLNCQVKSNVGGVLKPADSATTQPKSQHNGMTRENNTSLYKGIHYPSNNQSAPSTDQHTNRNELLNISRAKSLDSSVTHSLYPTYHNVVNSGLKNESSNNYALSSHLNGTAIVRTTVQNNPVNEYQLQNQGMVARDANFVIMKRTPPSPHKEVTWNNVNGRQESHRYETQHTIHNTPHTPFVPENNYPTFTRPVYCKPPMKPIILKATPVRLPANRHQNFGNPIPTVVNHNLCQPSTPARPLRFLTHWPPPNTNIAFNGSHVHLNNNGVPNCRMPVNADMPGHSMYSEIWRPPINEDFRNYFVCPPPPLPPPPPIVSAHDTVNTAGLTAEPPAPTGTVIGSNAEGQLIKKITIMAAPSSRAPEVNDKVKMLAELNRAVEELETASDKLEELKSHATNGSGHTETNSVPTAKPNAKACPLSKKKYNLQPTGSNERAKLALAKEPAKGYSPPILPIPSYVQAFEILTKNQQKTADILKKMESINANKEVHIQAIKKIGSDTKNKHVDSKPLKKSTKNKQVGDSKITKKKLPPVLVKKKEEKTKKISLDEYRKNLVSTTESICEGSKRKKRKNVTSCRVDNCQDLGYDSDATFVL